jgi:hypothetical protein
VLGPIKVDLHVSTSGTDSDFVVKVIDVFPATTPRPSGPAPRPSRPTACAWAATSSWCAASRSAASSARASRSRCRSCPASRTASASTCRTWRTRSGAGHRLMVQVQSSWFPLTDRNPQTFTDIPSGRGAGRVRTRLASDGANRSPTQRPIHQSPMNRSIAIANRNFPRAQAALSTLQATRSPGFSHTCFSFGMPWMTRWLPSRSRVPPRSRSSWRDPRAA